MRFIHLIACILLILNIYSCNKESGSSSKTYCKSGAHKITSGASSEFFGGENIDVAIYDGERRSVSIIGNKADSTKGSSSGAAYVLYYDYSEKMWVKEAKIVADDLKKGDWFGASVDLIDGYALIGAPYKDYSNQKDVGAAYLYKYDTVLKEWVLDTKFMPQIKISGDLFGIDVAVGTDIVLIGAHRDDTMGNSAGAAYVFTKNSTGAWIEEKLTASDGQAGATFGKNVVLANGTILISAAWDDTSGINSGAVYVFKKNGSSWQEEDKLFPSGVEVGDLFGYSIAVYDSIAVIGAPFDDDKGIDAGAVYLYAYNGESWRLQGKLTPSDGEDSGEFGRNVAISSDTIIVSAKKNKSGIGYIFKFSNSLWTEEGKITPPGSYTDAYYAEEVAISSKNTAIFGAQSSSTAAYIYCDK